MSSQAPAGVVTKTSARPVAATLERLQAAVEAKGLMVFALVDHSGEAAKAGLAMPDTKLLIFGSPAGGTPIMLAAPLAALDLPLKVLVWENRGRRVLRQLCRPGVPGGAPPASRRPDSPDRRNQHHHRRRRRALTERRQTSPTSAVSGTRLLANRSAALTSAGKLSLPPSQ